MFAIPARFLLLAVLIYSLLSVGRLLAQPKDGRNYFPLEVGHRWEYRLGGRTLIVQATKQVMVGKVSCIELQASGTGPRHVELLAIQKDGVYRYSAQGQELKPPLCVLRFPAKPDETWKVESTQDKLPIQGIFKLTAEEITVPAGRYKTVVAHSDDLQLGSRATKLTTWFAPNVGPVKQRLQIADVEFQFELEKFIPAP